ncbi:MAG: hypothetical protein M1837_002995 [Sclerophora amabilis]|nr:MAG: hypothetical protein M1837_002995 [Sclerophora amabilis]
MDSAVDDDPFEWSVEQVIEALCKRSASWLNASSKPISPDPGFLETAIRENDLDGLTLLTSIDNMILRDDLGIKSIGHRASVMQAIHRLRALSSKYACHVQETTGYGSVSNPSTHVPTWPVVDFGPPRHNVPGSPSTSAGYVQSPRVQAVVRPTPRSMSFDRQQSRTGDSVSHEIEVDRDKVSERPPRRPPRDCQQSNVSSGMSLPTAKDVEGRTPVEALHHENETTEAPFLVDHSGPKRRKVTPTLSQVHALSKENGAEDLDLKSQVISNQTNLGEASMLAPNAVADQSSVGAESVAGKMYRDAQGRKRMRPVLQNDNDFADQVRMPAMPKHEEQRHSTAKGVVSDTASRTRPDVVPEKTVASPMVRSRSQSIMNTGNSHKKNPPSSDVYYESRGYLGSEALTVDKVFYGSTDIGGEINFVYQYHVPSEVPAPEEEENFLLTTPQSPATGRQLYVHKLMRRYMAKRNTVRFSRDGVLLFSIQPDSSHVSRSQQNPSFTLFQPSSDNQIIATRQDLTKWPEVSGSAYSKTGSMRPSKVKRLQVPDNNQLELSEDKSEWDYLMKWAYASDHESDEIDLAKSSDDVEYDSDTRREIEEEIEEKEARRKAKATFISREEVYAAIDLGISDIVDDWKEKQLPKLEPKARRMWRESRRLRNKGYQISDKERRLNYLNDKRLKDLRESLADEPWTSSTDVRKKCGNMEQSLFEREKLNWEISVLKSKAEPPRGSTNVQKPKNVKPVVTHEPGVDEEDVEVLESNSERYSSSDEEEKLNEFIVPDENSGDTRHLVDEAAPGANDADDEDVMDVDSSSESEDDVVASGYRDRRHANVPAQEPINHNVYGVEIPHEALTTVKSKESSPLSSAMSMPDPQLPALPEGPETITAERFSTSFIDLTQISDSSAPEEVRRRSPLRTPPINQSDSDNPFLGPHKALASDPNKQSEDKSSDSQESPKDALHPTSKIIESRRKIAKSEDPGHHNDMDTASPNKDELFEETTDRYGLLVKFLRKMSKSRRKTVISRMNQVGEQELRLENVGILEAMRRHELNYRGMDQRTFLDLRRFAIMYLYWFTCKVIHVSDSHHPYSNDTLVAAKKASDLSDPASFPSFYRFLRVALREFGYEDDSDGPGDAPDQPGTPKARDSDSKNIANKVSSHQRRKRLVQENPQARTARENDRQRLAAHDARRHQLEKRLQKMGTDAANDTSRIVVNTGKFADQDFIYISPHIGRLIKQHQIEGVQFMWRELVTDDKSLQGCLLAHTMGLGKTMQVITFLVTLAEASTSPNPRISCQVPDNLKNARTLILCPPSLIDNWWDEMMMWAPRPIEETIGAVHKVDSIQKPSQLREIYAWHKDRGVLLISYDKFRNFVTADPSRSRTSISEEMRVQIREMLLNGPHIIVADEAHKMRNTSSKISKAASQFKSKSRIALTGSPLANNLEEYHSMINWIAPGYLGPLVEFRSKYVEPIQEGLYLDSSPQERRKSLKMLWVLKCDLDPKVNRVDISVLKGSLTPKTEFVIKVPLTKIQEDAYRLYVRSMLSTASQNVANARLWDWLAILSLLCNHPICFRDKLQEREQKQIDTSSNQRNGQHESPKEPISALSDDENIVTFGDASPSKLGVSGDLVREQLALFEGIPGGLGAIEHSHKVEIFDQILNFAKTAGDKTLVFSHSLRTLDFLESLFKKRKRKYERLDGKTKMADRQQATKEFNKGDSDVYLVSTRAGGLGLNLYGANRVIIFDFNFNPSWEEQAVGRAYRLGQKKPVYVYRFIAGGTFEDVVHNKAVFKLQLALNVVDKRNVSSVAEKSIREYLFEPRKVKQKDLSEFKDKDSSVLDKILAQQNQAKHIRSIELTETFRRDAEVQMQEEDRQEADQLLKDKQLERSDPVAYSKLLRDRYVAAAAREAEIARQHAHTGPQTGQANSSRTYLPSRVETPIYPPSQAIHGRINPIYPLSQANPARTAHPRGSETPIYPPGHAVTPNHRTTDVNRGDLMSNAAVDKTPMLPITGATTKMQDSPSVKSDSTSTIAKPVPGQAPTAPILIGAATAGIKEKERPDKTSEEQEPSSSAPSDSSRPVREATTNSRSLFQLSEKTRINAIRSLASALRTSIRALVEVGDENLSSNTTASTEAQRLANTIVQIVSSINPGELDFRAAIEQKTELVRENFTLVKSIWRENIFLREFSKMDRSEIDASMGKLGSVNVKVSNLPAGPRRDMANELQTAFEEMILYAVSQGTYKIPSYHSLESIATVFALSIELSFDFREDANMTPYPYPRKGRLMVAFLRTNPTALEMFLNGHVEPRELSELTVKGAEKQMVTENSSPQSKGSGQPQRPQSGLSTGEKAEVWDKPTESHERTDVFAPNEETNAQLTNGSSALRLKTGHSGRKSSQRELFKKPKFALTHSSQSGSQSPSSTPLSTKDVHADTPSQKRGLPSTENGKGDVSASPVVDGETSMKEKDSSPIIAKDAKVDTPAPKEGFPLIESDNRGIDPSSTPNGQVSKDDSMPSSVRDTIVDSPSPNESRPLVESGDNAIPAPLNHNGQGGTDTMDEPSAKDTHVNSPSLQQGLLSIKDDRLHVSSSRSMNDQGSSEMEIDATPKVSIDISESPKPRNRTPEVEPAVNTANDGSSPPSAEPSLANFLAPYDSGEDKSGCANM